MEIADCCKAVLLLRVAQSVDLGEHGLETEYQRSLVACTQLGRLARVAQVGLKLLGDVVADCFELFPTPLLDSILKGSLGERHAELIWHGQS
jgi:hypothetical protein